MRQDPGKISIGSPECLRPSIRLKLPSNEEKGLATNFRTQGSTCLAGPVGSMHRSSSVSSVLASSMRPLPGGSVSNRNMLTVGRHKGRSHGPAGCQSMIGLTATRPLPGGPLRTWAAAPR